MGKPAFAITFARSARKELERLPVDFALRILKRIEALAIEPHPSNSLKLQGSADLWRMRVGDYRVLYSIDESKRLIDVSAIRHRKDAYRP